MSFAPGFRLGPFEIISQLGAGGMGEVYCARDVRLGREVAIKVLLPALAADADAMERFAREARAVAALNHPNIVALFDIGRDDTTSYVVSELIDGSTLRERLASGPVPIRKAVEYAKQIAEALAAAHDRGIVHRDIKPENVLVSSEGRVKVLDFGLAQIAAATPLSADTMARTLPGAVFGTAGYMAPEQVRAQAIDHRADLFALGAVLYEMLTGRRAFSGATPADTVTAVLHVDPPPLAVEQGNMPASLARIVQRCLEKQPHERFQSARDLAFALDAVALDAQPTSPRGVRRSRVWTTAAIAAGALLIGAAIASAVFWRPRPTTAPAATPVARFGIPASMTWSDAASISPDGRYVVYTGGGGVALATATTSTVPGARPTGFTPVSGRFWLRRLSALESLRLSETEAAVPAFFWSTDSRVLGYRAGNSIIVRDVPDGAPRLLAELAQPPQAMTWNRRGDLVVALPSGLHRIAPEGGSPQLLLRSQPGRELWRGAPAFLPDGQRFLFTVLLSGAGEEALETRVGSLDGRELGTIAKGVVGATYADGHLLFGAGGALYAQAFDVERLALTGERVELARSVAQDWRTGRLAARASDTGILVFLGAPRGDAQFVVVDRAGRPVRNIGEPDSFLNFSLSPDEQRIMVARRDPLSGHASLWLIDAVRGITALVTEAADSDDADDPTWSPDGRHVAYRHGPRLVLRLANGGAERTLVDAEAYPDAFSRDGRYLLFGQPKGNMFEQSVLDVTIQGAKPIPLVTGVTLADESRFSPNGRWVAYHSNETGTAQVSVVPFPPTGEKWQLSHAGGVQPRWSADGDELFYLDPDGRMMAVRIPGSDPRQATAPVSLFATGVAPSDALDQFTPMGNGFLVRVPVVAGADSAAVQVIVNWKALIVQ